MPKDFHWRSVLDQLPEGLSLHSVSGDVLCVNRALCEMYGQSSSSMLGLNCQQLFHDSTRQCTHEQVVDTGIAADVGDVCVGGRTLSIRVEPLFDKDGRMAGFTRIARDVTETRRAQTQLVNTERFATLGQILFGLAHDIGTPLNIITGYSEYLLMRTAPSDSGHKELSTILQQTRRIAEMISEALDLARTPQQRLSDIDAQSLLADALALVGHHFRRNNVKAVVTCGMGSALIYGDASQLRQAFFNLLLNAGQQIGPGGKLEIVIEDSDKPGFITVGFWGIEATGAGHDFSHWLAWCAGYFIVSRTATHHLRSARD